MQKEAKKSRRSNGEAFDEVKAPTYKPSLPRCSVSLFKEFIF
jgi:hypothetical protein